MGIFTSKFHYCVFEQTLDLLRITSLYRLSLFASISLRVTLIQLIDLLTYFERSSNGVIQTNTKWILYLLLSYVEINEL